LPPPACSQQGPSSMHAACKRRDPTYPCLVTGTTPGVLYKYRVARRAVAAQKNIHRSAACLYSAGAPALRGACCHPDAGSNLTGGRPARQQLALAVVRCRTGEHMHPFTPQRVGSLLNAPPKAASAINAALCCGEKTTALLARKKLTRPAGLQVSTASIHRTVDDRKTKRHSASYSLSLHPACLQPQLPYSFRYQGPRLP
jgi:hypothetical protein